MDLLNLHKKMILKEHIKIQSEEKSTEGKLQLILKEEELKRIGVQEDQVVVWEKQDFVKIKVVKNTSGKNIFLFIIYPFLSI